MEGPSLDKYSIEQLILTATSADRQEADDLINMEILDRVKFSKPDAKTAILEILKILKVNNMVRTKLTLDLLEVISKNGTEFFL
jgi:hypothetical protein